MPRKSLHHAALNRGVAIQFGCPRRIGSGWGRITAGPLGHRLARIGGAQEDFVEQRNALFYRNPAGVEQVEDDVCKDFDGITASFVKDGRHRIARCRREGCGSKQ